MRSTRYLMLVALSVIFGKEGEILNAGKMQGSFPFSIFFEFWGLKRKRLRMKRIGVVLLLCVCAITQVFGQQKRPFITKWKLDKGSFDFPLQRETYAVVNNFIRAYKEGDPDRVPCEVRNFIVFGENRNGWELIIPEDGIYILEIPAESISHLGCSGGKGLVVRPDAWRLISVEQWGDVKWRELHCAFAGCTNMTISPDAGVPNLREAHSMKWMFYRCKNMNSPLNDWDVSYVTDMVGMFQEAESFNQPLDLWNVRNLDFMRDMFCNAKAFNQNLGAWEFEGRYDEKDFGLQHCGMDVENFSKTLTGWAEKHAGLLSVHVHAAGLYYNAAGRRALESLQRRNWYIDGARRLEHYILFRKPEFVARVDSESNLRISHEGLDEDEIAQLELEVEDESVVKIVDTKSLRIMGLEEGATKVTVRIPENDNHDELEATCQVSVKPSRKKPSSSETKKGEARK